MAKGGGGAWKVAYADFVTAMMAFFLVMWICGQDQSIKRAVSYYFTDPFGDANAGGAKGVLKSGSVTEFANTGSVPHAQGVALGRGRKAYTADGESGPATKVVSDWVFSDKQAAEHWLEEARRQRQRASSSAPAAAKTGDVDKLAARALAQQLRLELTRDVSRQDNQLYQDLMFQAFSGVNWAEIAEDLMLQTANPP